MLCGITGPSHFPKMSEIASNEECLQIRLGNDNTINAILNSPRTSSQSATSRAKRYRRLPKQRQTHPEVRVCSTSNNENSLAEKELMHAAHEEPAGSDLKGLVKTDLESKITVESYNCECGGKENKDGGKCKLKILKW